LDIKYIDRQKERFLPRSVRIIDILGDYQHKEVLKAGCAYFFVIEFIILLSAFAHTGGTSRLFISDPDGRVVYETRGPVMSDYEKKSFEDMFGPLSGYSINVKSVDSSFSLRGWLVAAVGIPLVLTLLLSLLVQTYFTLLYGEEETAGDADTSHDRTTRFGSIVSSVHRSSVFLIGFAILALVMLLWLVPNLLSSLAKSSVSVLLEFKWFFIGISVFLASLLFWIVFLRYKLSGKMLDNQLELQKFQLEKGMIKQIAEGERLKAAIDPLRIEVSRHLDDDRSDLRN
jgi:hypothetical protein